MWLVGIDLFRERCIEGGVKQGPGRPGHAAAPFGDETAGSARNLPRSRGRYSTVQEKGISAMNSRFLSALALPRGRVIAGLIAAAAFAALPAGAQQPPAGQPSTAPKAPAAPKAAPKATPPAAKKDAPPAGQPQQQAQPQQQPPQQDQVQLIYSPWTKFCLKGQDTNAKQVCFTGKDGRIESGQPVVAAVII